MDISKIENALKEIEPHISHLSRQYDDEFIGYTIPEISITNLQKTGSGITIADITAGIQKCPLYMDDPDYGTPRRVATFRELCYDWLGAGMSDPAMTLDRKAILLMIFKENININYTRRDAEIKSVAEDLTKIVDILLEEIQEAVKTENEFPAYRVDIGTLKEMDAKLRGINSISIIGLLQALFLQPKNYEKIMQHEKTGGFEKRELCRIKTTRQIIYK